MDISRDELCSFFGGLAEGINVSLTNRSTPILVFGVGNNLRWPRLKRENALGQWCGKGLKFG
ncbi:MAG: hypothetical protein AAGD05_17440, partial [Bacteroidota bacterium]